MTITPLPRHIDSTMMSCFRSCPRKYYLEFVLGLRPPGISIDLHAGGCFATAIEVAYQGVHAMGLPLSSALDRAHAAYLVSWGDYEIPEFKKTAKTKDRVWEAVEQYFGEYPPLTDHVQPYFVEGKPTFEFSFAIPLEPCVDHNSDGRYDHYDPARHQGRFPLHPSGEPFLYAGRFDMLGKYNDRPCVRDEKTSGGSFSTGWAEKWNLRSQFIGYTWACQQSGLDVQTVVVRGVFILKTKIDFAEAAKEYSDHIRARWYEQLRRDMWRLRRAYDEQYFDFNLGDSCTQFGSCMFMDSCQSSNPENWLSDFEVRHWNPLDKNPIQFPETSK